MLLSQVCRLNAAVAICQRYRLSEDTALILMYTLMILKRSDRFHWTWIVVQKREIQYDKRWKQYKSKGHLLLYFQNNNNGKCTWKNLLYNFYFRQTAILFLYFFNFLSLFFPTLFVLVLSYLSGTCTFFFADISGRDFFSSFGHFWAELFFQVGGGGARAPSAPPPPCVRACVEHLGEAVQKCECLSLIYWTLLFWWRIEHSWERGELSEHWTDSFMSLMFIISLTTIRSGFSDTRSQLRSDQCTQIF